MPQQKGIIKLKGTTQGICYYKLNGKDIARKASGPSKERIHTDPAFAKVKANNQEFGGAATIAKAIRIGLDPVIDQFKDSYVASRLSGVCRKIIQQGKGEVGQRKFSAFSQPQQLPGFQLNKSQPFYKHYTAASKITINNPRSVVTINIAKSCPYHLYRWPQEATHFQLTAAIVSLSEYNWYPVTNQYQPTNRTQNILSNIANTPALDAKSTHQNIILTMPLKSNAILATNITCTVWLGINGIIANNGIYQSLQTVRSMQCIAIR